MPLKTAISRAARAMREDAKLHFIAVSSLTVAFLCMATALFTIENLSAVADAWGRSARMSIYLQDDAGGQDVEQLMLLLDGLPEVVSVDHLTQSEAQAQFIEDAELDAELANLPADVFPASLEVELRAGTPSARLAMIGERISNFRAVDDVETYQGWFDRLEALVTTGRVASGAIALLVVFCVFFVVANTIRLAIAGRRDEIEVLKLCGASDDFVRNPFLIEGAVQGMLSASLAVLLLFAGYLLLRTEADASIAAIAGVRTVFLPPAATMGLVVSGAIIGAAGSALSLRRYLTV